MKTVLIVGMGNIGQKLYNEYKALNPDCYDPYKRINTKKNIVYDFAFIAVDTPSKKDGTCDLSQVREAIQETDANIIVLRSTVPPTTTDTLSKEFNKHIVYSPEFYGTTQHSSPQSFDFNFTILGGDKKDTERVAQLLEKVYNCLHRFCFTDSKTAELVKYFENTMLASKVSLCVQFYNIARQFDINYSELRELLLQDERIGKSHTFVYEDTPYWDSHCFNKDLKALVNFANAPLIEDVIKYNDECKDNAMIKNN